MSVEDRILPEAASSDVVAEVAALAGGFRARVPVTEAERSVPAESVQELFSAGVARMLVPPHWGGSGLGLREFVEVVAAAAYGCPATGWVAAQMAHHPHLVGMFELQAQAAVWSDGPDVMIASSVAPMGRAEEVDGGYRLTGRHTFASGVNHASWVVVGAMVPAPAGPPEWRLFLVNSDDYRVEDVWRTAGMRGTGSNTVVIDDLFVPSEFTISQVDAREGTGPGGLFHPEPKYRLPWMAYSGLGFTSTMLGAVQGAYDASCETLTAKRTPAGKRVAEGQILQVQVAFTSARKDTARTLLLQIADRADSGASYTIADRATVARDNTFVAMLLQEAIDTLLEIGGTGVFSESSPVQQAWRDVHFAQAHISVNRTDIGGRYGRLQLDVEDTDPASFF